MDNNRLKRLQYQSWYRGCKETDLLLGAFAREKLPQMPPEALDAFERLLGENDVDIFRWLTDQATPPEPIANDPAYIALKAFCAERV